jgi:acyl-CoA thioester hydrolase
MPADRFEIKINVLENDIDENGHVNNVVYLRWVQDAAAAHWQTLATEEEQQNILWVVRRHEIDYLNPANLKDEIVGVTWVGEAQGLTFERHTEILRAADRKLLAKVRTIWIPVNVKTRKPVRIDADTRRRFSFSEM